MNFQFRVVDRYFDGIIVVTDYLKNMAMKNGVSGSRVLQVPHFIDPRPFFRPEIQQLRSKENVTFGFCGDTNVRNGLIDLLIAFEKTELSYKNIRLIIIGSRFQELEQHLSGITNLELKAKIEITGFVSATVVQEKLNLCDILINPRRNGRFAEAGFPTKLGEYFSTRLPVISTVTGDIRKYFTHEKEMILTQPENPVELANAMMRLIINESERKAIGERGYKWACEHLEYKANALIVKQFIEKM